MSTRGCCCLLPSWVGMAIMGIVNGLLFAHSIYVLITSGQEATGLVLFTGAFFAPFAYVFFNQNSIRARQVLLFVTVIAWILLIGSFTLLGWFAIGITQGEEGKDQMRPYFYSGLAVLVVSAIGFIDCARNFLIEKRADLEGELKSLL